MLAGMGPSGTSFKVRSSVSSPAEGPRRSKLLKTLFQELRIQALIAELLRTGFSTPGQMSCQRDRNAQPEPGMICELNSALSFTVLPLQVVGPTCRSKPLAMASKGVTVESGQGCPQR